MTAPPTETAPVDSEGRITAEPATDQGADSRPTIPDCQVQNLPPAPDGKVQNLTEPDADVQAGLDVARDIARAGVPIFLAEPDGEGGFTFPPRWQHTIPDPAVLDRWRPGMAVCAVMGTVVDGLDIDPRNGGDATADGLRAAGICPRSYGRAATPNGGSHDLIAPLRVGSRDGVRPGMDIKGGRPGAVEDAGRGFLFIAPTVRRHKVTGEMRRYRWEVTPDLAALDGDDDTGDELAHMVREVLAGTGRQQREPDAGDAPAYDDHDAAMRARVDRYIARALAGITAELRAMQAWPEGHSDDRGHGWEKLCADAAYRLGSLARAGWNGLTVDQARAAFTDAAPTCSKWTRHHVAAKWTDQAHRGEPAPWPPALDVTFMSGSDAHTEDTEEVQHERQVPTTADGKEVHRGQARFAYRLASAYSGRLRFVPNLGWLTWTGQRWTLDDKGAAHRAVLDVLRSGWRQAFTDRELGDDVRRCESAAAIRGVLDIAATLPPLVVGHDDLDADPYLLNCADGTLDLRTMQKRPHDPADHITKVTRGAYRPGEAGAAWDKFLADVLPDAEVREFLQRVVGVALLGKVVEHVLPILVGTGANGKGVCYSALLHALGDYAAPAEPELFTAREGAHPVGQMDLMGRRLVVVSESDKDRRLAEATMKRLTGGDTIKARAMRQNFVEFRPSHTALLVTNHLPRVSGDDEAIWRRVRVVPFTVVVPEQDRDSHLGERLELEADAVLAWAVAGYADYVARGHSLAEPASVRVATADYRTESDAVARFLAERCYLNPHVRATTGDLFADWTSWAVRDGAESLSQKAFGQALDRHGYPAGAPSNGKRWRAGLELLPDEDADQGGGRPF